MVASRVGLYDKLMSVQAITFAQDNHAIRNTNNAQSDPSCNVQCTCPPLFVRLHDHRRSPGDKTSEFRLTKIGDMSWLIGPAAADIDCRLVGCWAFNSFIEMPNMSHNSF